MSFRNRRLNFSLLIFLLLTFVQVNAQRPGKNRVRRSVSQPVMKARFVSGESSLRVPFESSRNLVLMQASVNDSAPLWFIFDTGATSTVIDNEVAKTLRLRPEGSEVGSGAAGTAEALVFRRSTLRFPNVEATNLTIYGLPLDFLSGFFGRKIGGVIGNDIIRELVVEIDYASRVINFYKPASFRYSGGGEVMPMTFELEGYPFVRASVAIEGRPALEGKFELDTGATGAVLFNTPFVNRNRLLKSIPKTKQINSGGVGGSGRAFVGRVAAFRLGRFTFENPLARFFQGSKGDNASAKYDGLVGGEIFRRFKVIFDYSRRRVIFEPNANLPEAFEEDMSGLDLAAEGENFSTVFVNNVEEGSPAAEAGIQEEDIVTAIDGHPAAEITLEAIRRMFMQDGRAYILSLRRGEKVFQTKLKLRRLI